MKKSAFLVGLLAFIALTLALQVGYGGHLPAPGFFAAENRSEAGLGSAFRGLIDTVEQVTAAGYRLAEPRQNGDGGKLVLGGSYTLETGNTLNGDLIILGGSADIQEAAFVNGDVVVLGGSLNSAGTIQGDVLVLGGLAELANTALVQGDVTTISGNLNREPGAVIEGEVNTGINGPLPLPLPAINGSSAWENTFPGVVVNGGTSIWDGLYALFRSFMWAALAVVLVLFFPKNTQRVAGTVVSSPAAAFGLGLLSLLVAPVVMVFMAITIIGIPFALFLALVVAAAWAYGLIAVGAETGKRLGQLINQTWALPVSAAIGAFILTILINGISQVVPCVGWLAPVLVGSTGLGAVVLTMFGTRSYPQEF